MIQDLLQLSLHLEIGHEAKETAPVASRKRVTARGQGEAAKEQHKGQNPRGRGPAQAMPRRARVPGFFGAHADGPFPSVLQQAHQPRRRVAAGRRDGAMAGGGRRALHNTVFLFPIPPKLGPTQRREKPRPELSAGRTEYGDAEATAGASSTPADPSCPHMATCACRVPAFTRNLRNASPKRPRPAPRFCPGARSMLPRMESA
jgi:hypothetical protein